MIVVDSSVWIDFFKGHETPAVSRLTGLLREEVILVGDIILCEVLKGARSDAHAHLIERVMRQHVLTSTVDAEIVVTAASNYRKLRSKGITVRKTLGLIIGTFCIKHNHTLLHSDRDFDSMETFLGLKVVPTHPRSTSRSLATAKRVAGF